MRQTIEARGSDGWRSQKYTKQGETSKPIIIWGNDAQLFDWREWNNFLIVTDIPGDFLDELLIMSYMQEKQSD